MRIIVGLGNPGDEYKNTRHNAGFMAVDEIARVNNCVWNYNKKFKSEICELRTDTAVGFLAKPQTFMNNSGESVSAILNYYHLLPKRLGLILVRKAQLAETLTVIHDDLDIDLGKYKISMDSRSAGHRGVQSIIDHIKTQSFKRIRIGVRTENLGRIPADKFVLQKFSADELKIISETIKKILAEQK